MKFESVTGKSTIYVYQDFLSQILVYNMIQDIRKSADEEAAKTGKRMELNTPCIQMRIWQSAYLRSP